MFISFTRPVFSLKGDDKNDDVQDVERHNDN